MTTNENSKKWYLEQQNEDLSYKTWNHTKKFLKDTLKAFDDFKNKQKSARSNVFDM